MYCLVYRTGGTDNFKWHRSLPIEKHSEAMEMRDANMRMGYHTFIENHKLSVCAGLPETYTCVIPFV